MGGFIAGIIVGFVGGWSAYKYYDKLMGFFRFEKKPPKETEVK